MAGRAPRTDLVGTAVLALLTRGPRHAWDLHRFIVDTHKDFVTGLPRSLYHAMQRLAAGEFIAPVTTGRHGRRPERTTYGLTEAGRDELSRRMRRLLTTPGRDSTSFVAGLSLMACLPVGEVEDCLRARASALAAAVEDCERTLADLIESGVPRLVLVEAEYERTRDAAELAWIESILAELASGELGWDDDLPSFPEPV